LFWVKPEKKKPSTDTWEMVFLHDIPLEFADAEIPGVYQAKIDHYSLWESLRKKGVVSGEYEKTPRGRILCYKEVWTVLAGNYAFNDDVEFAGKKDLKDKVWPNLKKMILEAFNLPQDSVWMQDTHYNIKGMETQGKEDNFDFDFEDDGSEDENGETLAAR
jgi:hypothetical protein